MMRLFRSTENFASDIVQIEILVREDGIFKRLFKKNVSQGKTFKCKTAWVKLSITESQLYKKACAFRNDQPYKLHMDGVFLYSAPVKPTMGPN